MAALSYPVRGQVFEADVAGIGRKLWLVVSNNAHNRNLGEVLVVRLTMSRKEPRPSIVELDPRADAPWVLCDDLGPLYRDELGHAAGALSRATMRRVDLGLVAALGFDIDSLPRA